MIKIFTVAFFLVNSLFSQNPVVQQFSDSFADVAEAAKPAVVTIITDKIMKVPNNDLYFFFNPYMDPNGEREYKTNALGSGVIVDAKKGYIITNNHVVEDMDNIKVNFGYNYIIWHNPDFKIDEIDSIDFSSSIIKNDFFLLLDYRFK